MDEEVLIGILGIALAIVLIVILIVIYHVRHNPRNKGYAVVRYKNGDKYEGYWLNKKKHGHGVYYWHDGHVYTGNWEYDKRHGRGEMLWVNKKQYIGYWRDDKCYGKGIMRYPDGTKKYGIWYNDILKKGKTTASKHSGQYLSFFVKEGVREYSRSNTISDRESHIIDRAFIMHEHEIPYYDYKIIAYDVCEHFYMPFVSDKRETLICIGDDKKLYDFISEIRNLLKLYTDSSVRQSISKNPKFCRFIFEDDDVVPTLRKYNNADVCFTWKDSIDDYQEAWLTSDYQKRIIQRVQYVQDILFEFDAFKFDKDCLVIDEDKRDSLIMSAKIKSFVKKVGVVAAKQAAKFAVMAAAGFFGANIALGDDSDGFDGDIGGDDFSLDYDPDMASAALPPAITDVDFDVDDIDYDVDSTDNISNITFGQAPNDGSYMRTSQSVDIQVAGGNNKGSFDVYLHHGDKYVKFKNTWIKIQGLTRFHLNGNDYVIK